MRSRQPSGGCFQPKNGNDLIRVQSFQVVDRNQANSDFAASIEATLFTGQSGRMLTTMG
jgi:hypothetical protein